MDDRLSEKELRELCILTAELTRQKLLVCEHLCIENFAADLLGSLMRAHAQNQPKPIHDSSVV